MAIPQLHGASYQVAAPAFQTIPPTYALGPAGNARMRRGSRFGGKEIELKFALDPAVVAVLKRHPLFATQRPSVKRFVSVYFDTDDHDLRRNGMSLRLRKGG